MLTSWLQSSANGWREFVVPPAQRHLGDPGEIFKGGAWPSYLEQSGTRTFPEGRFPCITSRLRPGVVPHGRARASDEAVRRCQQDGSRWPFYWYESAFIVWKEGTWRLLLAEEAESLMGLPRRYTEVPDPKGTKKSHKVAADASVTLIANA